jgi:acyl carrier protein
MTVSVSVAETVVGILAQQAMIPPDAVQMDATPQDLGLDSLGLVEAIFAIEEAFDVTVPFNANDTGEKRFDMGTVGQVVAAVQGLVAAKSA